MDKASRMHIIATRLEKVLKEKGVTQAELAGAIAVHVNTIYNWVNEKNEPSRDTLKTVAKALGVSIWDLIPGRQHVPKVNGEALTCNIHFYTSNEVGCKLSERANDIGISRATLLRNITTEYVNGNLANAQAGIQIPNELLAQIERVAKAKNVTSDEYVRQIIEERLENEVRPVHGEIIGGVFFEEGQESPIPIAMPLVGAHPNTLQLDTPPQTKETDDKQVATSKEIEDHAGEVVEFCDKLTPVETVTSDLRQLKRWGYIVGGNYTTRMGKPTDPNTWGYYDDVKKKVTKVPNAKPIFFLGGGVAAISIFSKSDRDLKASLAIRNIIENTGAHAYYGENGFSVHIVGLASQLKHNNFVCWLKNKDKSLKIRVSTGNNFIVTKGVMYGKNDTQGGLVDIQPAVYTLEKMSNDEHTSDEWTLVSTVIRC